MISFVIGVVLNITPILTYKEIAYIDNKTDDYLKPYTSSQYTDTTIDEETTDKELENIKIEIKNIQIQRELEEKKKELETQEQLKNQITNSEKNLVSIKNTPLFTPTQFIDLISPKVIEISSKYNMFASIGIANAIQESFYGNSYIAKNGNNLFGIKAYSDWMGDKIGQAPSNEDNGNFVQYRAYISIEDSITDFYNLLQLPRYKPIKDALTVNDALKFHETGYAGDSSKDLQLLNIINQYNLTKYDSEHLNSDNKEDNSTNNDESKYKETLFDKITRLFGISKDI